MRENRIPGFERTAGFYAWRTGDQPGYWSQPADIWVRRYELYAPTTATLEKQLADHGWDLP